MLPLPFFRLRLINFLLISIFSSTTILAQTADDLERMGKDAKGFIFHLKFNGSGNVTPGDAKYAKITALLDKYKSQVDPSIQKPFKVQGPEASQKPFLIDEQRSALKNQATMFFREMAEQKLTVQDLQRYKEVFKNRNPKQGDNPVDPKIAWKAEFEGIERTLMGGRTMMIMDVWKQTLIEHFNNHPEAVGVIYGQMDIGSWVKMNVDGLGFAADIDFSTIATDAATNQALHNLFAENLKRASGLGMIPIDVVHTSHGLAGADVFIGEWGKAFAEVDMLKRGKWKLLEVIKNENGQITDIKTVEKEGKELFMEKGIEQELKAQKKDGAKNFDPKERYPVLSMNMEPMLSLEMLRHAIHDIEHGPFEGGQKIIKMIKYTERSFFMINEALKTIPASDAPLYFNLSSEEQDLKTLCDEVIKNKAKPKIIAKLLETFTRKNLDNNEQVNLIVDDIVEKCKKAMLKNANQAFGYRFKKIAQIEDEAKRFEEADKFLDQINEEIKKGFEDGKTKVPETMRKARFLLSELRAGKIPASEVDAKLKELNDLMEKEYRIDKSFVERWVGDAWNGVKKFFIERGYGPEAAQKLVNNIKEKMITEWKNYAPDNLQKATTTVYEKAAWVNTKLNSFNEHMAKSKPGKILSSEMLNQLDNAFALYDAWMSGKTPAQSAWRVSWTAGTIWAQGKWPFLAIPLGIYNSLESKSVAPAAMAVAFYLFPMAGQVYMVTNLIDRLIVSNVRDINFRMHLDRLAVMAETDGQGHVVRFKVPRAFTGLTGSPDSLETDPDIAANEPARTEAIKTVFYNPEFMYCPDIKYFTELIPRRYDQFGMYDSKLKKLVTLFSFDNDFIGYLIGVQKFKEEKEKGTLPNDDVANDRLKMIDSLELVIEDRLWIAVFKAIESTKKAEKEGVVKELEATIVRIQDSLFLDDSRMKKIDSLSLLLKIRKEIQNDPMYKTLLKNTYAQGTAYDRIAIPTFERYINIYRQIQVIQDNIFKIWQPFKVDATKLQQDPMRLVLIGGLSGAPMLTTDPVRDMQMAIKSIEAHTKRATDIRMDLANALGRPINEKDPTDIEHLKVLGQLGFGFERLVDANPEGRSPYFKDEAGVIVKKMQEITKQYREYLEKIKQGPPIKVTLKVNGENETSETVPVTAEVTILNEQNKPVIIPAGTTLEWYLFDENTRKDIKITDGNKFTHNADKQGSFSYSIKLIKKVNDKQTIVASTIWYISVKRFDASNPSKGIQLKVPAVIKQYDIFDVSITVPSAIKGKEIKCNWGYSTIGKNDDCSGAKIQYNYELTTTGKDGKKNLVDSTTVDAYITVMIPGKTYGDVYQITRKVKFQHMSVSAKASEIWEGGSGPNWLHLQRKTISNQPRYAGWMNDPTQRPRSTATAYATVGLKDKDPFETIKNLEDLKALMEKKAKELAYKKLEVKEVSFGDFKGYGVYSPINFIGGGWSFEEGHRPSSSGISFDGYVMKGKKIFTVYWSTYASGASDNLDKGWMMNMVKQLAAEAEGILRSASFQPDGRLTKSPYTGPKLDGSDYPQVSIEPKVDTIQPGSKVSVNAVIKNDKPEYGPYTYSWSGQVDGNPSGKSAQLISDRPGKKSITVSVDGTTPPGSANMEYVVAPLKLRLTKVSPTTNKIIVGMPVELRADFISVIPAGKKLQYLWQPHPEEKFEPFEGTGNTTKIIFTKPGNKKVWVQVLDKTTAETITMGESDQLEFVVEKPAFSISFNPAKAVIGQQVTAIIKSTPEKLEEVSYRWMPLPANAQLVKESQDGSEIIFYAKNAMQIPFEVLSLVKGSGEELGKTKSYFNAERYNVKVEGPKVQGPKPMIWQPGVGLVEVDKEIAVHQIIEFTVVVTPQPTSNITYDWKVTQGNASISNPTSRDARVTALETGTVQVNVTVKDNNAVVLGIAVGSFNATISNEMITNGNNQKKLFDEKMQQARNLLKEGKLDEAVKIGLELKEMNAKDAAPVLNELGDACKKASANASIERDFELAIKRCNQALQLNPNDTTAKKQLEEIKKWMEEWTTVQAKGDELDNNISKKDLPAAEKNLNELNKLQENMPGKTGNKWSEGKTRQYTALVKSCDSAFTITRNNWTNHFNEKDFETGLKDLTSFQSTWTSLPVTKKEIENLIQLAKTQIAEQKKIYEDFLVTKLNFEKGLAINANQGSGYIQNAAITRFGNKDPRQKEMIDFARIMEKKQNTIIANKIKADQLKTEGQQAETAGNLEIAIGKYKESITLVPDATLAERIRILEAELSNPLTANKNKANTLWNEGEKLVVNANTWKQGIDKMKESLKWWNNPERIEKVRTLEKDLNGTVSQFDISGVWKHGNTETFAFTSTGDGQYTAVENGFGNARGSAIMVGEIGFINYTTQDGLKGQYIITFANDGKSATGKWTDSRNSSGQRNFILLSKPITTEPDVTNTDGKKKKKNLTDILNGIGKGLGKLDSILTGKKPVENVPNPPVKTDDTGVKPADTKTEVKIFDNGNIGGVSSGPQNPTQYTFSNNTIITRIENYHYFNGGKKPGTIGLRNNNTGIMYGPWQAYGLIGQGGVQNAYWDVLPNIEIPAGTYTVIDSDPSTWSYNSQSNGCGFTNIWTSKTIKQPVPDVIGVKPADAKTEVKIFENGNIGGVSSGPANPTLFTFNKNTFITRIENYHYFNGGKKPGTIGLRNNNTGKIYGQWQAYGLIGQGGVQNAYWDVLPNIEIPAGTYTVIDSDPVTWSYNSESKGCGFTTIWTSNTIKQPVPDITGVKPADAKTEEKVFENGNIGGVSSGPTNPTLFTFNKNTFITRIENYHYFNGGKKPGTISLHNNSTGKVYGPWQAYGLIGQGGVQNAYWDVLPNIEISAGTYTVIDSDPPTWSYNSQSNGCGFTTIWIAKGNKPVTNPNDPGYTIEEVETGGGVTAEKICIAGDIDNLGFGFPKGFDVFSGNSTPSHGYPWKTDPTDAMGTDRIMVGTGAKGNSDGYSGTTSRPGNQPQPITLTCMNAGMNIQSAVLQLFVDDFQAAAFGSKFSVTINDRRAAFLETVLNSLNQTGPIGKLISVQIPADFINEIQSGRLVIFIDDATSGKGDGYAVDFVRLIINPTSYSYTGTITGIVLRPDGQPAAGALINAGGIISTTANSNGEFTLKNVPAGMVSINASYNNHHHKTVSADLASGKTIRITINLPVDDAPISTQQPTPDKNEGVGWVGIERGGILYGTVFKTKEETGITNPYNLQGIPLPNTTVMIEYQYNFTNYKKNVTSDGSGKFEFTDLPLTVSIRITSRGQVITKTLTTASPKQYVLFGWDGEIIIK